MNISILQENLSKSLSLVQRIVSNKTQLPILQNVLLTTENGFLRLTTTNMETTVTTLVGAKEKETGSACVSVKLLTELVASLPTEAVNLVSEKGSLKVSTSRAKATIPISPPEEFPPTELSGGAKYAEPEKGTLKSSLSFTLFAAATDEGRPVLSGVKIRKSQSGIQFVATDGYRLSIMNVDMKNPPDIDTVVPGRALSELFKVIADAKEDGVVSVEKTNDGQIMFLIDDTAIITRLIDGEYPDFEKIIPKTHTTQATTDVGPLLLAVKSASIFARDNANIVRLKIDKNLIIVSANAQNTGEGSVDVEADVEGEGGEIAFNSRFLVDLLSHLSEERVVFQMTGPLNPGVFLGPKDKSYLHIIMPVRVQG